MQIPTADSFLIMSVEFMAISTHSKKSPFVFA